MDCERLTVAHRDQRAVVRFLEAELARLLARLDSFTTTSSVQAVACFEPSP